MKCPSCGWEVIGKCGNPDCTKGDKKRRPGFAAPLRARRGARGGRVRNYQAAGDSTIEDRKEQGDAFDYATPEWLRVQIKAAADILYRNKRPRDSA